MHNQGVHRNGKPASQLRNYFDYDRERHFSVSQVQVTKALPDAASSVIIDIETIPNYSLREILTNKAQMFFRDFKKFNN